MRSEKRKAGGSLIEAAVNGTLKPWREVVTPHKDVASGRYQQAEFAADLWQVHLGEGTEALERRDWYGPLSSQGSDRSGGSAIREISLIAQTCI
ncbi:MAG: hypothetical protein ACLQF1_15585 [Methyloceanibacter sp.]